MPSADIDIAKISPYATSNRTLHTICASLSHDFNPRNLESMYYPAYHNTFVDLLNFDFNGALMPRAQSNVCISSAELERQWLAWFYARQQADPNPQHDGVDNLENEQDGVTDDDDSEEYRPSKKAKILPPPKSLPSRKPAVDEDAKKLEAQKKAQEVVQRAQNVYDLIAESRRGAADPADAYKLNDSYSSVDTVPDQKALSGVPDFLFCHSFLTKEAKPTKKDRLYAWEARHHLRIIHECFPFFGENKASPGRHKPDTATGLLEWNTELTKLLQAAHKELLFYISLYFTKDLCAQSVIAFAASGLHWQWCEFKRDEIPKLVFDKPTLTASQAQYEELDKHTRALEKLEDSTVYLLGTDESDCALEDMRKVLIAIVNSHTSYGPTMVHPKGKADKGKGKATSG